MLVVGPAVCLSPAAAAVPLSVVAVIPGDSQTSLIVDLGAGTMRPDAVSVTLGGAPQRATVTSVLGDRMAVALVVDASEAGGTELPAWLSAATRLVLEVPAQARAVVVADTAPPAVIAAPQPGVMGVIGALSTVRAAGRRNTSDALTLAIDQFADASASSRLVVLYTTAPDAGGESSSALSARLNSAGAMLVVVGAADGGAYWSGVTRPTGGFFAPAGVPVVVPALDQVATTLRGRYRVTFPTPKDLPARASVHVASGDINLVADVVVPADGASPTSGLGAVLWVIALVALLAAVVVAALLWRRAHGRPGPPPPVARGRASVPGTHPPPST